MFDGIAVMISLAAGFLAALVAANIRGSGAAIKTHSWVLIAVGTVVALAVFMGVRLI